MKWGLLEIFYGENCGPSALRPIITDEISRGSGKGGITWTKNLKGIGKFYDSQWALLGFCKTTDLEFKT